MSIVIGDLRELSKVLRGEVPQEPDRDQGEAAAEEGNRCRSHQMKLVLPVLLFVLFCGNAHATAVAPNIVLITIDTLRADHLGCYGYGLRTSPHLDQLASEGI